MIRNEIRKDGREKERQETKLLTICNRRGYLNGRLVCRLGIAEKLQ